MENKTNVNTHTPEHHPEANIPGAPKAKTGICCQFGAVFAPVKMGDKLSSNNSLECA